MKSIKYICLLLLFVPLFFTQIFLIKKTVRIEPIKTAQAETVKNPATGQIGGKKGVSGEVFTQDEIDEMTENTQHPTILRKLIKCESQNVNIARMDSNHLISFGILQFNGVATWAEFSARANVSGSPMEPEKAIKVADWMLGHGELYRWSCAKIEHLL